MKKTLIALTIFACFSASALAQSHPPMPQQKPFTSSTLDNNEAVNESFTKEDFVKQSLQSFDQMDTNHDGILSKDEMVNKIKSLDSVAPNIASSADALSASTGNGSVAKAEFIAQARTSFDLMDANRDGNLTTKEMIAYMQAISKSNPSSSSGATVNRLNKRR